MSFRIEVTGVSWWARTRLRVWIHVFLFKHAWQNERFFPTTEDAEALDRYLHRELLRGEMSGVKRTVSKAGIRWKKDT